MSSYIKRESVLAICEKEYKERLKMLDYSGDTIAWNIGNAVKNLPAADVVEVKHGKWELWTVRGEAELYCSVCGNSPNVIYEYEFCPSCGAKMDLEE